MTFFSPAESFVLFLAVATMYMVVMTTEKRSLALRRKALEKIPNDALREVALWKFREELDRHVKKRWSWRLAHRLEAHAQRISSRQYPPDTTLTVRFSAIETYGNILEAIIKSLQFIALR